MTKWIFAIINTISLIVIILLTSIEIPTFSHAFYIYEYEKNGTYDAIGISAYDLERVTYKLMAYMKDKDDDLEVYAAIHGESREFFNSLEKSHMVDVKNLFLIGYAVRRVALLVFFITLLCAFVYKRRPALKEFAKSFIAGVIVFLGGCLILTFLILGNFDKYFTIFHEIFFDNDLWILNPQTDLLVNIVPQPFFIDIFQLVIGLFLITCLIIMLLCIVYLKYVNNKPEAKKPLAGQTGGAR